MGLKVKTLSKTVVSLIIIFLSTSCTIFSNHGSSENPCASKESIQVLGINLGSSSGSAVQVYHGSIIKVTVYIKNTGGMPGMFFLGASIIGEGETEWKDLPGWNTTPLIAPGEIYAFTFSEYTIPYDAYIGYHGIMVKVWTDASKTNLITERWFPAILQVVNTMPAQEYILYVESGPIIGLSITYSGDYAGSQVTNFTIGPKASPFTVTLIAPLTWGNYEFTYWLIDGVVQGHDNTVCINIDNVNRVRTAVAVYSANLTNVKMLEFNVLYKNRYYKVRLEAPLSNYNNIVQRLQDTIYTWYPNMDREILNYAYYVYYYMQNPSNAPIESVSIIESDGEIPQKNLKIELLADLITYCYTLFLYASPDSLNMYSSCGEQWLKAHDDLTFTVKVLYWFTKIIDWATIIAPVEENLMKLLGSREPTKQIEFCLELFFSIVGGNIYLIEKYGNERANKIIDILIQLGYVSSYEYNGAEVYEKFLSNPSKAVETIERISKDVFESSLDPAVKDLLKSFILEIEHAVFESFAVGTAVGLHAYFISKLSVRWSIGAITDKAFNTFVRKIISPLTLAKIIHRGYNMPMATSLHQAWNDMKLIADLYFEIKRYGFYIANPQDDVFNLTNIQTFASLLGIKNLIEFDYYINCYRHTIGQFLNPKREQEANVLKSMANSALSQANNWAKMLKGIHEHAEALMKKSDPEGFTFILTFEPPVTVFPTISNCTYIIVVIVNGTSSINLKCGRNIFIVQHRKWFSNFTKSLYVNDLYDNDYIVMFDPPEGIYAIELESPAFINITQCTLKGDIIKFSTITETTAKNLNIEITSEKESRSSTNQLWIIYGIIITLLVGLSIGTIKIKIRKSNKFKVKSKSHSIRGLQEQWPIKIVKLLNFIRCYINGNCF